MRKLPKARFNLKTPTSKSETLIFLIFRYQGKKVLHSTSLSIHPSDWDKKSQRPIQREHRKDLWILNQKIESLSQKCRDIYISTNYGDLSAKDFKAKLLKEENDNIDQKKTPNKAQIEKERVEFLTFLDTELEEMKDTGMKKDTLRGFKLHANLLKEFAKENGTFTYEDVDWAFRLKLIDWMTNREMQLGYGNKLLKVLRMFLERARKKKIHTHTDYQGRGWMVTETKARGHKVYFNPKELQVLADLKLTGIQNKVRDLFLIGAGTGQRFSDYSKYVSDDFYTTEQGVSLLSVISQKTLMPAKIPLNIFPWLIPILEKHHYASPKVSMQKTNMWIKEICKEAGFTNKVLKIEQYMGRKPRVVKSYVPKYKEVASHTCRRSFATNLYKMGFSISQIMPMTGHATESQLRDYIGIDGEQNAESIGLELLRRNNASFPHAQK